MKVRWPGWLVLFSKTARVTTVPSSLLFASFAGPQGTLFLPIPIESSTPSYYKWIYHWKSSFSTVLVPYLSFL